MVPVYTNPKEEAYENYGTRPDDFCTSARTTGRLWHLRISNGSDVDFLQSVSEFSLPDVPQAWPR